MLLLRDRNELAPVPVEDYAYDEEGNRTASHLSALYASNAHNQLEEDEAYSYAYDPRGNRVSKTSKATGDVETYAYDSQNQLAGPSHVPGNVPNDVETLRKGGVASPEP